MKQIKKAVINFFKPSDLKENLDYVEIEDDLENKTGFSGDISKNLDSFLSTRGMLQNASSILPAESPREVPMQSSFNRMLEKGRRITNTMEDLDLKIEIPEVSQETLNLDGKGFGKDPSVALEIDEQIIVCDPILEDMSLSYLIISKVEEKEIQSYKLERKFAK